jgi:PPM family protein phosphatase
MSYALSPRTSPRPTLVPSGEVWVSAVGRTDVGLVRTNNEDAFLLGTMFGGRRAEGKSLDRQIEGYEGLTLAVSDGMGGAQAGEVASALVVRSLRKLVEEAPADEGQVDPWLGRVVERVSTRVWEAARRSSGDSRAYLLRAGRLHQVTHDQSYVQVLLDAGVLTPSEARTFPLRNVILQTMGQGPGITPALARVALCQGDIFLLCSDGLTGMVLDDEIRDVMISTPSLEKVAARLVELANERGGDDNTTVVLSRVEGASLPGPSEASSPTIETVREYRPRRVVF